MKLLFSLVFASVASICSSAVVETAEEKKQRELDSMALHARWFMHHPEITYDSAANEFTLDFPMSSTEIDASLGMMEEEFYDINCKDDGSGFEEYIITSGITGPDGISPAKLLNGPDGKPQLKFKINTQILANDSKIYAEYGGYEFKVKDMKCPLTPQPHPDRIDRIENTGREECSSLCRNTSDCVLFSWGSEDAGEWEDICILCNSDLNLQEQTGFISYSMLD